MQGRWHLEPHICAQPRILEGTGFLAIRAPWKIRGHHPNKSKDFGEVADQPGHQTTFGNDCENLFSKLGSGSRRWSQSEKTVRILADHPLSCSGYLYLCIAESPADSQDDSIQRVELILMQGKIQASVDGRIAKRLRRRADPDAEASHRKKAELQ